jgi:peptidyl-tRNA hydrolase, PTH1 family
MPRVAVLLPQTYMNESGRAVGPARGEYRLDPEQVVVV